MNRDRIGSAFSLLDKAQPGRFATALELGCAEGMFTELIAPRCDRLLAVDFSPVALERAKHRLSGNQAVRFGRLDIRHETIEGTFELVMAMDMLTYIVRPWEVRRACDKVVDAIEPGGLLLFSDPRQSKVFETAPWGRMAMRGGEQVRRRFASDRRLEVLASVDMPTHVLALFRRRKT